MSDKGALLPGVRFMLLATFMFTLMKLIVKSLPHIPAIEIIFFRAVVSLVISIVFLSYKKIPFFGTNRKLLILRGLTGAASLIMYFYILQKIPLASAATLQYLSPILATILGAVFLSEKVKNVQWIFFGISFSGVLFANGFDNQISAFYIFIGIASAFFSGLAYNLVRRLNTSEHPQVIIFYFPLVLLPIATLWTSQVWVMPKGRDWIMLLAVGIATQLAQYYMTKSYQTSEIAKVSILNYLGLIYAVIFGYFLFEEVPDFYVLIGVFFVLLGVWLNMKYTSKVH